MLKIIETLQALRDLLDITKTLKEMGLIYGVRDTELSLALSFAIELVKGAFLSEVARKDKKGE